MVLVVGQSDEAERDDSDEDAAQEKKVPQRRGGAGAEAAASSSAGDAPLVKPRDHPANHVVKKNVAPPVNGGRASTLTGPDMPGPPKGASGTSGAAAAPSSSSSRASAQTMKRSRNRLNAQDGGQQQEQPQQQESRQSSTSANGPVPNNKTMSAAEERKVPAVYSNGGAALDAASSGLTGKRGRSVGAAAATPTHGNKGGADVGESGIDLVDFLQSTGSIIALSKFLDEEDEPSEEGVRDSLG